MSLRRTSAAAESVAAAAEQKRLIGTLSSPFIRQDIFYAGSVTSLREYKTSHDMATYVQVPTCTSTLWTLIFLRETFLATRKSFEHRHKSSNMKVSGDAILGDKNVGKLSGDRDTDIDPAWRADSTSHSPLAGMKRLNVLPRTSPRISSNLTLFLVVSLSRWLGDVSCVPLALDVHCVSNNRNFGMWQFNSRY